MAGTRQLYTRALWSRAVLIRLPPAFLEHPFPGLLNAPAADRPMDVSLLPAGHQLYKSAGCHGRKENSTCITRSRSRSCRHGRTALTCAACCQMAINCSSLAGTGRLNHPARVRGTAALQGRKLVLLQAMHCSWVAALSPHSQQCPENPSQALGRSEDKRGIQPAKEGCTVCVSPGSRPGVEGTTEQGMLLMAGGDGSPSGMCGGEKPSVLYS